MWNRFKAALSIDPGKNSKTRIGLPFIIAAGLILIFSGAFNSKDVFAQGTAVPQIDSHYNCLKSVDGRDLGIKKITKVQNPTDTKTDYCPVLSHPGVLTNNTPQSFCADIDPEKISILEPSGLTYDSINKIWVGVSDNYNVLNECDREGYTVFYFNATAQPVLKKFEYEKKDGSTDSLHLWIVETHPLLTAMQADDFKPNDLEGIEYDEGNETFYMTGSLGKHASKPDRDTWERYKTYRFKIDNQGGGFVAGVIDDAFLGWGKNFREWVLSENKIYWGCGKPDGSINCYDILNGVVRGRPENQGGLNIEALALGPSHDASHTSLLFGIRGPIYIEPPFLGKRRIYSSFLDVGAVGTKPKPLINDQLFIRTQPSATQKSEGFGLRAMTLLQSSCLQADVIYAVILGPTDSQFDNLKTGLIRANPGDGIFYWTDTPETLPKVFVGEGVAVRNVDIDCSNPTNLKIKALLVDDINAHALVHEFTYKP